jgi:hypothetical protein
MRITRKPRAGYMARPADWQSHQSAAPEPQWFSYGLVVNDQDGNSVEFNADDGQVYVNVQLEPSKSLVRARIASSIAGAGEGEFVPYVPGDEVACALPMGREDGGVVILGRLNNALDKFPMESVAGQDPTKNAFGFRRRRTPFVEELAGPVTFRNALTGSLLSMDSKGGVMIKDSENSTLQIDADAATLQGPSDTDTAPKLLLQLNFTEERGLLQIGDAMFLLNSSKSGDPSRLVLPSDLFVSFGGNQPAEHVATTEFVLAALGLVLSTLLPISGSPAALVALTTAVAAGIIPLNPVLAGALSTGLPIAASTPKPPPSPLGVQLAPGLGAVRFHTG